MAATTRSLKVFLCNADQDQDTVLKLYQRLKKDNVDAWLAEEELLPGEERDSQIHDAVRSADAVLVCLSNFFNREGDQQREVRLALDAAQEKLEGQIFIIPVRLEECEVPKTLKKWQFVDLYNPSGYERLTLALRKRANDLGITLQFKKDAVRSRISAREEPRHTASPQRTSDLPQAVSSPSNIRTKIIAGVIGSVAVAAFLYFVFNGRSSSPEPTPVIPTVEETASLESTSTPEIEDSTPSPAEALPPPTPTDPLKGKDGMQLVEILAGEFSMGSKGTDADERPVHTVYLDTYLIDQTEVTNAMYAQCAEERRCDPPKFNTSLMQNESNNSSYFGNPDFDNYPVVYVAWADAKAYCKWAGRCLPTEAEWEKAASWDDSQKTKRLYPWGSRIECFFANYYGDGNNLCVGDTTPVGRYASGASFYGVLDMAGNVWEWVADRYERDYYKDSTYSDPLSTSGNTVVVRGGSFLTGRATGVRSSDRDAQLPDFTSHNLGFRCAVDKVP